METPAISDGQLAAVLAFLAAAGAGAVGFLKWVIGRVLEHWTESTTVAKEGNKVQTLLAERIPQLLASNDRLVASNDRLYERLGTTLGRVDTTIEKVDAVSDFVEEITGQHDAPELEPTVQAKPYRPGQTPRRGVGIYQHRTPQRKDK